MSDPAARRHAIAGPLADHGCWRASAAGAGVATGLPFGDIAADGLLDVVRRAMTLHRQPDTWRRLQRAGMRADVGWQTSAAAYAALYRRLTTAA